MKKIGIISYNINCNFTNYGSALQTWALYKTLNKIQNINPILVDYCPKIMEHSNPLKPFTNMWDKDEESINMCKLALPAIEINYKKFMSFYETQFNKTKTKYYDTNFENIIHNENIDGFVCGSDTIFCHNEFGFDQGYYANYNCMKGKSISYAASFGDAKFNDNDYKKLDNLLNNFLALGIREYWMIPYIQNKTSIPVSKTIDPTLLLNSNDYDIITSSKMISHRYLLIYSRRHNEKMQLYAEYLAKKNGWKIIEISLKIHKSENIEMYYEAGVEEFLNLVKNAEFVVTNSYHGMIFSIQYKKEFVIFLREQTSIKVSEFLEMINLKDRLFITGQESLNKINYEEIHKKIEIERENSYNFLIKALNLL